MIGARMVIACVVAAAFVSPARAQGFPNKTMRLIVPLPPVRTDTNVVPMPTIGKSKEHDPLLVRRKLNK
jgi:hypothetical protein